MDLKEYIKAKGYRIRWVAAQIGMKYHAFWCYLRDGGSLKEEHAKNLEVLFHGDWVAVPNTKNRLSNRWVVVLGVDSQGGE